MPTKNPNALLERLLRETNEGSWIEFKHNNCEPDLIGRTVSACANGAMLADRDRAYIIWGVEDRTKRRLGTEVRLNNLMKGGENLTNWLSRMIEPRLMLEFLDFEDRGQMFSILVMEPTYDRPVMFSGSEYLRIGENIRSLREFPEHERTLWLATGRRKFESAIALTHQEATEILEKLNITTYYQLKGEDIPKNNDEILRKFVQIGCLRDNMEGTFDITNLGALLFANDITVFPSISSKSVRVIKYSGRDKMVSEEETEGKMGYAVGFQRMLRFIMRRLPREERIIEGVRRSSSVYSEIAIREIIANALIHQDFTITGAGPLVEIYENRIEVINPGNSLIEADRIIDERQSRNEKFASTMRELGICEERGGGIDKAIIEIEQMRLPAPEFYPSDRSMRVVIFGPKKFAELSKADKVWSCFCHCVVRWLKRDYMSNTTLRERFSLTSAEYQAVSGVIFAARKEGRIVAAEEGQGKRNARYVPYWAGYGESEDEDADAV
jgi:ATP-dependent DNA helicase RecG